VGSNQLLAVTWADERYPGLMLSEVVRDLSSWDELAVEVFLPVGPPFELTAALTFPGIPGTSAYLRQTVQPGQQTLRYSLRDLLPNRSQQVSRVVLHTDREAAGRRVLFGTIFLRQADLRQADAE
jgi:hypothetical protein